MELLIHGDKIIETTYLQFCKAIKAGNDPTVNFLAILASAPTEWEPLSFEVIKPKKRSFIRYRICWSRNSESNQRYIDQVKIAGSSFEQDLHFIWLKFKNPIFNSWVYQIAKEPKILHILSFIIYCLSSLSNFFNKNMLFIYILCLVKFGSITIIFTHEKHLALAWNCDIPCPPQILMKFNVIGDNSDAEPLLHF